jgi:hypothetical protein
VRARCTAERAPRVLGLCVVRARERILVAFFSRREAAVAAYGELVRSGVPEDAIRVLLRRVRHADDLGVRSASRAAAGAALGAALGVLLGGVAGALAAAGAVVVPRLDAFFAGPSVAALAGAGAAAVIGLAAGAVVGACVPAYEAVYLDDAARLGGALLAVHVGAEGAARVGEILAASGAVRVARRRAIR